MKSKGVQFLVVVVITWLTRHAGIAGPRVLIDQTRLSPYGNSFYYSMFDNAWQGITDFVNALRSKGYVVEPLERWPITPESFLRAHVLIIPESLYGYRDSEIEALKEFVANGGGLFVSTRNWEGTTETRWGTVKIVEAFGSGFATNGRVHDKINCYFYWYSRSWIPMVFSAADHPLTQGVKAVYFQGSYVKVPEGASVLLQSSQDSWFDLWVGGHFAGRKDKDEPNGPFPVMIAFAYGQGRVVIAGDASFLLNDWIR